MTPAELDRRWHEESPYWVMVSDDSREGERHYSHSAARTAPAIVEQVDRLLPTSGRALELGSGTGQHVVAFAGCRPGLQWIPSDPHPAARKSISRWVQESGCTNIEAPLDLDLTTPQWEDAVAPGLVAVVAINLLQVTPWSACTGLLRGAATRLLPGGLLLIYGCFKRGGEHLSRANAEFERSLAAKNPAWGVREVEDVAAAAAQASLDLAETVAMPADNLMLVLRRR